MNGTITKLCKRGWGLPFLAALILLCCGGVQLQAQSDPCKTDTLRLNTGWNHLTNSLDGVGVYSNFWKVIADPSPNTTEPRPAITIPTYVAWAAALPNSRWMSSYPSASNDTNGTYTFQACFCIGQNPGKVKFVGDLLADDRARVYINGTLIGSTPLTYAFVSPATHLDVDLTQYVKVGKNCIEIEVDNTGNVAMGFDLAGYVTATNNLAFDKPQCCDRSGSIIGMKFWDKNCNGKQDVGDVGLLGWTIKATNGVNTWTTTTDALGNYYFTNLPAGNYTVSEVNQVGWTQSYPTGAGTYSVALLAGQVISNRDFGNCRNQEPTDGCFLTQRDSIWCVTDATGAIAYNYRFDIKSLIGCNGSLSAAVAVASPAGVSVSPATFPVSNAWSTQNLNIYGPGAVAGATVKLVVTVCCKTPGAQDVCCTDTITVKLPDCHPVQQGCFQIVEDSVYCKEGPNGQSIYGWCFKVKNLSNCPATYFTFYGPAGITVNPVTIVLGYLAPGATSGSFCVQISGPMAVPGPLVLNGVMCNRERTCCCDGSITIKLPDCKKHGCCDDFLKRFGKLTHSASSNGNTTVNGWMAAAGPGGTPIIKVEATLANLSINGLPAYGYFVNGTIANPFGFTTGVMTPYGNELIWPTIGGGVAMNFPTPFNLRLKFQPMAPGVWKDVVRYCIRFRFTDKNCITCDTVICFSRIRYKFIIWTDISHLKAGEKGSSLLSSGAPGIDGHLVGSDSAALALTLPSFPAELGAGHYVGLSISANDANLTGANASGYSFLTANGMATSEFDAQAGSSISLGLSYDDFGTKNAIEHELGFRYVLDSDPLDTLEESVSLVIRRESLTGGDVLGSAGSNLRSVKTYALHLENANGSKEPIDRLVLGTSGGTTILAVGPTANDTTVAIGFRANPSGGRAAVEVRGEAVGIDPGTSQNPIYVTLAGVQGNPTVHFATYNSVGQLISEGDLILSESLPSSVTRDGSEGSGTTGTTMLEQSFPNPATHSATINFHLDAAASSVSLVLNDAAGRQVVRLIDAESLAAGEHAVYLNADGLATGTYYYTISVGDHRETRAMQIVK